MSMYGEPIKIYPNLWRILGLMLGVSVFMFLGYYMTKHPRQYGFLDGLVGYAAMAFCFIGVLIGLQWLILIIIRKPLARIYDDRVEYWIPMRMKYEIISFRDVVTFEVYKHGSNKSISAMWLHGDGEPMIFSSGLVSVDKVCDLLNDKLEQFWADRKKRFGHREDEGSMCACQLDQKKYLIE